MKQTMCVCVSSTKNLFRVINRNTKRISPVCVCHRPCVCIPLYTRGGRATDEPLQIKVKRVIYGADEKLGIKNYARGRPLRFRGK